MLGIAFLAILLLLIASFTILAADIAIFKPEGQSANERVAILAVSILQKATIETVNSNQKPNTVAIWENEIPGYAGNNPDILASCLENTRKFVPILARSSYRAILASNQQMKPKLQPYLLKTGTQNPAMLIAPGGAYIVRSEDPEGVQVARWLNSIGISAFVLDYRLAPYAHPAQLADAQRAIRYLRYHADEFNIDPNRIGILGFSAGGHLAAMAGTLFEDGNPASPDPVDRVSSRPDLMVLAYAVTSTQPDDIQIMNAILLGAERNQTLADRLSPVKQVTAQTPPAFIWQCQDDPLIPAAKSEAFAEALMLNGVPYELHIFPKGGHGIGLATDKDGVGAWPALCEKWLRERGFRND